MILQASELTVADGKATVKQQTEFGYDRIEAPLPAVAAFSRAVKDPRYPTVYVFLGAFSIPSETVSPVRLGGFAADVGRFGASKVWGGDDPALAAALPQPRVDVLAKVVREGGYDTVLFAASVLSADVAAGLAARLDAGLNWDLIDLTREDGRLVGKRPALGDSVYVDVGWRGDPKIPLVRSVTFQPVATGGGALGGGGGV